ncbi:MAG: hypothetical protein NT039_02450 [Candidatus Berkelbacteria bacterium]|nr:hypothetical protein [Candidatus Berkelbacteria bacterium]
MSKKFLKQLGAVRALLLASFVVGLLFFGSYVFSVSAEIKNAGPLKIEYPGTDPLFSATNIAPGYSETKTLTITNQGTIPHSFAIAVSGTLGPLAEVLHIAPEVLGVPVWDKTIAQIATAPNSNTIIGSIAPGGVATVDLMAYLPDSVGNDYQGKETLVFSFVVGNEEPEPTYSPSPSPSPGGTGGGAAFTQGVGQALGVSTSPSPSISPSPSPSGGVEGEKDKNEAQEEAGASKYKFLYWLIPILVILLILFFLWWRRRRRDEDEEETFDEEI